MANPLFQALGGAMRGGNNPMSNMTTMMKSFNQFKSAFTGDPKQTVQGLLNSGRMTQDQYNQLGQMATQFMNMMKQS